MTELWEYTAFSDFEDETLGPVLTNNNDDQYVITLAEAFSGVRSVTRPLGVPSSYNSPSIAKPFDGVNKPNMRLEAKLRVTGTLPTDTGPGVGWVTFVDYDWGLIGFRATGTTPTGWWGGPQPTLTAGNLSFGVSLGSSEDPEVWFDTGIPYFGDDYWLQLVFEIGANGEGRDVTAEVWATEEPELLWTTPLPVIAPAVPAETIFINDAFLAISYDANIQVYLDDVRVTLRGLVATEPEPPTPVVSGLADAVRRRFLPV